METITMTSQDQRRANGITKLKAGELTVAETAILLRLSERSVWRLARAFERDGIGRLVHGNRRRASPGRLPEPTRARIVELARTRYEGVNDCHLAELLAEYEGIAIGRSSLRRLLRSAEVASPRRRRAPRHRSRRDRMPQAGLLVQLDGSRHDWLEKRRPRLTLVGAIDDATGLATAATSRDQEDAAGHLTVLRDMIRRHGVPHAVYRDRHGIFETPERATLTLEEPLADTRTPTQFRAGARRARGDFDRRPESPGEGPDRAPLGDAPGPARHGAAACGGRRPRRGERPPLPVPSPPQPPVRRPGHDQHAGLASATATGRVRARVLSQVSPDGRPRRHDPGRGDDPPAAGPLGAGGARPDGGSNSTSDSTVGSSCGTASGST
jgi:transposase